ncbi:hypothetical protein ACVXG7_16235 [Enterobacter hormaechei]
MLCDYDEKLLTQISAQLLLDSINNQTESFYPGQPALVRIEDLYKLRASFMPIALLNGENMAKAIDDDFQIMNSIHQRFISQIINPPFLMFHNPAHPFYRIQGIF